VDSFDNNLSKGLARIFHEFTPWRDCDHETGNPLSPAPHRTASGIFDKRYLRQAGSQFRDLATAIHEISGLGPKNYLTEIFGREAVTEGESRMGSRNQITKCNTRLWMQDRIRAS